MTDKFNFQGNLLENDSRVLTEDVAFKIVSTTSTSSIVSDDTTGRTVQIPSNGQSITSVIASIVNPPTGVTIPGAKANLENGILNLQFYNLKGDVGPTGNTGPSGKAQLIRNKIYPSSVYEDYEDWKNDESGDNENKTFQDYIEFLGENNEPAPIGYAIDDNIESDILALSFFLNKGDKGISGNSIKLVDGGIGEVVSTTGTPSVNIVSSTNSNGDTLIKFNFELPKGDTGSVAGLTVTPTSTFASEFISGIASNGGGSNTVDTFIKSPVGISTDNLLDGFRLPVDKGGTGLTVAPSMTIDLESTSAVDIFTETPSPGVTGTLPIAYGGTGLNANPSMIVNLGSAAAANVFESAPSPGVTGTLPIAYGGTGASTTAAALTNLGIEDRINEIAEDTIYIGTTPPTSSLTKIWIRTVPSENDGS